MIRSLRAFFLSRLFREKILLVSFVGLLAVLWFFNFNKRFGRFWLEQSRTTTALAEQQRWIDHREEVQLAATKAAGLLEPAKTYRSTALVGTVMSLADEAGLKNPISNQPVTTTSAQFSIHSFELQARGADWASLRRFYEALLAKAPYISIEKFNLTLTGGQHSLALTVSSFESAH